MNPFQQLQSVQNNPQMMEKLVNSPIDPNAVMKYQLGGAMPEMPGVTMGVGNPSVPQAPYTGLGMAGSDKGGVKSGDVWSQMGNASSALNAAQPKAPGPMGPSPMLRVGEATKPKATDYSSQGPRGSSNSISQILAGFRK